VPASGDSEDDSREADGMYIGRGNRSSRRKPAPVPLLSITKSHMTRPGFEPGHRGGKPASNRLSYGAAEHSITIIYIFFNLCGGTLGTAATTGLLYQPRMIGDGDCGKIGGMKIGRGNRYNHKLYILY
jgi:hypothetical protein